MESHLEARLWNDIFVMAQDELGIPHGTIKATVLIETILATFELEEILYELREHSAGLNAGRWDYIFSCIKKFKRNKDFCLAKRGAITMEVPFMRAYALALVKACHKRGAPAIGGMSALIPIKNDPAANEKALAGIRHDKTRDANDGFDGGWVAHPGLVGIAMEEFVKVLGDRPNQWDKQRDDTFGPKDWLELPARAADHRSRPAQQHQRRHPLPRLMAGRQRLRADPQPDGRRRHGRDQPLAGLAVGALAEGHARRWPQGHRRDGEGADPRGTRQGEGDGRRARRRTTETYDQAAGIFEQMSLADEYPEFLTLPLYEAMD